MPLAITEFSSREDLMQAAAERLATGLQGAIDQRGGACAALSGGSTPEPAYRALAAAPLDWPRVTFALVDERFVPPAHDASNERMARRALALALSAGAAFKPLYSDTARADEAASIADQDYAQLRIDVAVMGMGADGHTASWFPGADRLDEVLDPHNLRTVTALHAAQAQGSAERLTLTRAALSHAGCLLLLIAGAEKRDRLEAALAGEWAPVAALFGPDMPPIEVLWAR